RRQAWLPSDPAQKARLATKRWRRATADGARNSRTHRRRIGPPAANAGYPVLRHAINHMLHRVAATLRCRLRWKGEPPQARPLHASQELRPPWFWTSSHRVRESDESKPVALRARGSWLGPRRL